MRDVCDTLWSDCSGKGRVSNTEVPFNCIFNIAPAESDGLRDFHVRNDALGHPRFQGSHRNPEPLGDFRFREKTFVGFFRNSACVFVCIHVQKNGMRDGSSERQIPAA